MLRLSCSLFSEEEEQLKGSHRPETHSPPSRL